MTGRKVKIISTGEICTFHQWIHMNADDGYNYLYGIVEYDNGIIGYFTHNEIQFLSDTEPTPNETAKEIVEMLGSTLKEFYDTQSMHSHKIGIRTAIDLITDKYLKK